MPGTLLIENIFFTTVKFLVNTTFSFPLFKKSSIFTQKTLNPLQMQLLTRWRILCLSLLSNKSFSKILLKCFVALVMTLVSIQGVSQSNPPPYTLPADPTNQNIYPPAPETWEFVKYGEYPVSRETGLTNISIPIHTVTVGELSLPISLSYHASGIKVDQKATWVGLGWNLNAGGVVSRVVKGYPDELPYGYLNIELPEAKEDFEPYDDLSYQNLKRMMAAEYDTEPDEFNVNVPGFSAKFYLDPSGKPVVQPLSDADIQYEIVANHIVTFTCTTPHGVKYKFGSPSETVFHPRYLVEAVQANTTWYLTEMSSASGSEKINFFYKEKGQSTTQPAVASQYVTFEYQDDAFGTAYMGYTSEIKAGNTTYLYNYVKVVDRIEFSTGKIIFNSGFGREDDPGELMVNSIDVYGADDETVVKGFDLTYDYFTGTGVNAPPTTNKRLKLSTVIERGSDGSQLPPYSISYLEEGAYKLPPLYSTAQDYWGYFNGKFSNANLLPQLQYPHPEIKYATVTIGSADRNPHAEYMKAGIIQKIEYPTGGRTEFEFEANQFRRTFAREDVTNHEYALEITPPAGGGELINEKTLDIPAEVLTMNTKVLLSYSIQQISQTALDEGDMSVGVLDMTTGQVVFGNALPTGQLFEKNIELQSNHQYRLYVHSGIDQVQKKGVATIRIFWRDVAYENVSENTMTGGLRIRGIASFDEKNVLQTQKFFDYTQPGHPEISSGSYNSMYTPTPNAFLLRRDVRYSFLRGEPVRCLKQRNIIVSITAAAAHQQGYPIGDLVTYQYVTEYSEDPENSNHGKSIYEYDLHPDELLPFMVESIVDKGWLRGQLKSEQHLDGAGNVKRSVVYNYDIIYDALPPIRGIKVGELWEIGNGNLCVSCSIGENAAACWDEIVQTQRRERVFLISFNYEIDWKRLASISEVQDGVEKVTTFEYDTLKKHTSVTAAQIQNSDGKVMRTEIKYAHELNESVLLGRKMTGVPLASDVYQNGQLTGGNRITYAFFGTNYIPKKYEQHLADQSYLLRSQVDEINSKGQPSVSHGSTGIYKGIIWGHGDERPLAEVTTGRPLVSSSTTLNPTYSTVAPGVTTRQTFIVAFQQAVQISTEILDPADVIGSNRNIYKFFIESVSTGSEVYSHDLPGTKSVVLNLPAGNYVMKTSLSLSTTQNIVTKVNVVFMAREIFHTSFEEFDGTIDANARTGQRSHSGNYVIPGKVLVARDYVISFFENTGGGWKLRKSAVTHDGVTDITLSSTGKIDEVRIYGKDVQMQTATYDPITLLVTSQTDANNVSSFYQYDEFGRLLSIKDDKGNILKTIMYNYLKQ